ncbi:CALCINEURIN B [Salix koriyanagi]|uniref:Calcineurin B-like protein n=1 Tax=Salix koriyanagi TaxID=2511006 RepID=A0A9Q0Q8P0_9ROSI|nr:CALCINEURIN B [Salix koriyanagi]
MVVAILSELDSTLTDDAVDSIVDKTMIEADLNGDGRIDPEEWKDFVTKNPSLLKNMTLPYLKELTLAFPKLCAPHRSARLEITQDGIEFYSHKVR